MTPLVSIIIPVYNVEGYLKRCINSLLQQTYRNFEVILVNDGSTDRSGEICDTYVREDGRVRSVHQKNQGVSSARNKGIETAAGDYLTFVDADDWLELNAVEAMISMAASTGVDCVRTHYRQNHRGRTTEVTIALEPRCYREHEVRTVQDAVIKGKIPTYVYLLLVKRSVIQENNIRFDENLSLMEDMLFYVSLLSILRSVYISDKVTYNYTINLGGASKSPKKILRNARDVGYVNEFLKKYCSEEKYAMISAMHVNRIAASLITAFEPSARGIREVLRLSKEIRMDTNYIELVSVSDLHCLALPNRITVQAVARKRNIVLILCLFIKSRVNLLKRGY